MIPKHSIPLLPNALAVCPLRLPLHLWLLQVSCLHSALFSTTSYSNELFCLSMCRVLTVSHGPFLVCQGSPLPHHTSFVRLVLFCPFSLCPPASFLPLHPWLPASRQCHFVMLSLGSLWGSPFFKMVFFSQSLGVSPLQGPSPTLQCSALLSFSLLVQITLCLAFILFTTEVN